MFGDGATNTGNFHEALNLASAWKLPVLFICEKQSLRHVHHISRSTNITDLSLRAASYGIKGKSNDGNDPMAVYESVKEARLHVLEKGPVSS
jgi:pyruvate dehydrogenase E1 component alpha subunit